MTASTWDAASFANVSITPTVATKTLLHSIEPRQILAFGSVLNSAFVGQNLFYDVMTQLRVPVSKAF